MEGDTGLLGWKFQRQWQKRVRHCDHRVDREKSVTISKIAIPLKVGAAMAAEIAGVRVLTGILDLILCKCLSVQNINHRTCRLRTPCNSEHSGFIGQYSIKRTTYHSATEFVSRHTSLTPHHRFVRYIMRLIRITKCVVFFAGKLFHVMDVYVVVPRSI